ncbi:hypothetical protein QUF76_06495 [Desulfobacterales bacterium HSG16]|nr:hypothetical protein [Desulfobacterales bacterium HSG16]
MSGKITPPPSRAGANVFAALTSPAGQLSHKTAFADETGAFVHDFTCTDITIQGNWTVQATWAGEPGIITGADSNIQPLEVSKSRTHLTLASSSYSIFPDEEVVLTGKLKLLPECPRDLSVLQIDLIVTDPDDMSVTRQIPNVEQQGNFSYNFDQFTKTGEWKIQAVFSGNDAFHPANSEVIKIHVVDTAGYAIIIQGKIFIGEGLDLHDKTTDFVYRQLKQRGFEDDDIMYFNYGSKDDNPLIDEEPSKEKIQQSLTQWAKNKMTEKPGDLYIIMVGHGDNEVFPIYPDIINSGDIASSLDTLHSDVPDRKILLFLGFSGSDSFIDDLSKNNRVIIASTAADELSFRGPACVDNQGSGLRHGEYFIKEFFNQITWGKSVKTCFEEAVSDIESFTLAGFGAIAPPWYDGAFQHPLIDDNGDGSGSNDLSRSNHDGLFSDNLYVGVSALNDNTPDDIFITRVSDTIFLTDSENTTDDIWAQVNDNTRAETIWIEVKPPKYMPEIPVTLSQVEQDFFAMTGSLDNDRYKWNELDVFSDPGMYQVFYFAEDNSTGILSSLMETRVYKAKQGNSPPDPFELVSPTDMATAPTSLILNWQDAIDPEGDRVIYTVLVSKNDPSFTAPIIKQGLMSSGCSVTPEDDIEDFSTYHWKVLAIDEYGAVRDSDVRTFCTDEDISGGFGYVEGSVTLAADPGRKVADATIFFTNPDTGDIMHQINMKRFEGDYECRPKSGKYNIQAKGDRYISSDIIYDKSIPVFEDGSPETINFSLSLKGDIDEDASVDLDDIRKTIRFFGGIIDPTPEEFDLADCNGDGEISMLTGKNDVKCILYLSWGGILY